MVPTTDEIDIMYVEDDELDILSMKREFEKVNKQIKIVSAMNGKEALDKLHGNNGEQKILPKIILLDLNMPQMNGIEFLETIRKEYEFMPIKVFILTGAINSQDKIAMQHLNVSGHIIKPFSYSDALNIFWSLEEL